MGCNKYLENEMQMETKTDEKEDDQTGFVSDKAKCRHAFYPLYLKLLELKSKL